MSQTPTQEIIFTHDLPNVATVLNSVLGCDHKMVAYFLTIRPRHQTSTTTTQSASDSYKLANWAGLNAAARSLDWSDFSLSSVSQEAVDTLYANLHSIINKLTPHAAQPRANEKKQNPKT